MRPNIEEFLGNSAGEGGIWRGGGFLVYLGNGFLHGVSQGSFLPGPDGGAGAAPREGADAGFYAGGD
jgi:hypothetical protein